MPGLTDQEQRDMEAQFRAEIRFARRERDDLRARVERIEVALRTLESEAVLFTKNGWWRCERCWTIYHINERFAHLASCPFAALGAAGETENANG